MVVAMEEKTVTVLNKEGEPFSKSRPRRAERMVRRNKAIWVDDSTIQMVFTKEDAQEVREQVKERDGNVCYLCEEVIEKQKDITIDHIYPKGSGGEDSLENMAVCCRECNAEKSHLTPSDYVLMMYARAYMKYHNLWFK